MKNCYLVSASDGKSVKSVWKMARSCLGAAFLFTAAQTAFSPAYAAAFTEVAKLTPTGDFVDLETYGSSIAISGNRMVVGMPLSAAEAELGLSSTAWVYVKENGKWKFQATLLPPVFPNINSPNIPVNAHLGCDFGKAVAISGNLIVVGAPDYADRGAVYIYMYSSSSKSWYFADMIIGSAWATANLKADIGGGFGTSVATNGNLVVVGDPNLDGGGMVYVYQLSSTPWDPFNFAQLSSLSPNGTGSSGAANMPHFGSSVDINGNTIVVGCPQYHKEKNGSAHVFTRASNSNYWYQKKIEGSESRFGTQVAIDGDTLAVTSIRSFVYNSSGNKEFVAGGLSIYKLNSSNNWSLSAKLGMDSPANYDYFGGSLDLQGDTVIVGASRDGWLPNQGSVNDRKGAAYVFRRASSGFYKGMWSLKAKLTTNDTDTLGYKQFGSAVALEKMAGNKITAVIGDPGLSTLYIQKGQ